MQIRTTPQRKKQIRGYVDISKSSQRATNRKSNRCPEEKSKRIKVDVRVETKRTLPETISY